MTQTYLQTALDRINTFIGRLYYNEVHLFHSRKKMNILPFWYLISLISRIVFNILSYGNLYRTKWRFKISYNGVIIIIQIV